MILLQAILGLTWLKSWLPESITGLRYVKTLKSTLKAAMFAWLLRLFGTNLMETYRLYQSQLTGRKIYL